ncbi:MAG: hypothetical protein M1832_004131 [Thelocarpon impressellum]|nr:MAG: hypothetical protein M1832_004131 [Thelocarpon impressellum]
MAAIHGPLHRGPRGRPRPSECSGSMDAGGEAELVHHRERAANDQRLKSRFEEIFQKYGNDFTDLGDEIDLKTGEIVVNKGHLEDMRDELDTGVVAVDQDDTEAELQTSPSAIAEGLWMREALRDRTPPPEVPSDAAIIRQFGPDLGRRVADYVKDLRPLDESQIEPAWRVNAPSIPIPRARPRTTGSKAAVFVASGPEETEAKSVRRQRHVSSR